MNSGDPASILLRLLDSMILVILLRTAEEEDDCNGIF